MVLIETCRCGVELIVTHGAITKCSHCDTGCAGRSDCGFCHQLAITCTDCGTAHCDSQQARKCEQRHPA